MIRAMPERIFFFSRSKKKLVNFRNLKSELSLENNPQSPDAAQNFSPKKRKSCKILMFCLFQNKQSAGGCKLKGNLLADPTTVSLSKACQ